MTDVLGTAGRALKAYNEANERIPDPVRSAVDVPRTLDRATSAVGRTVREGAKRGADLVRGSDEGMNRQAARQLD